MRYELIDGDTGLINILIKDGWLIENTFPNPYPQPYFFALMKLTTEDCNEYDLQAVKDKCYR